MTKETRPYPFDIMTSDSSLDVWEYPEVSHYKRFCDLPTLGLPALFQSSSFAAVWKTL